MDKTDRLNSIIGYYAEGKPTAFAKFLGVAPSTISSWIKRDTLDYDLLFAKCEGLSPLWLLSGEGDMIIRDTPADTTLTSMSQQPSNDMTNVLLNRVTEQAEEIGRLKARVEQLEEELQKVGSSVDDATSTHAALA